MDEFDFSDLSPDEFEELLAQMREYFGDGDPEEMLEISCSKETLQEFARYEIPFSVLSGDDIPMVFNYEFVCEEPYEFTLNDLEAVLKNTLKKGIDYEEFYAEWYGPIRFEMGDALVLPLLDGQEENYYQKIQPHAEPFILNDTQMIQNIFIYMDNVIDPDEITEDFVFADFLKDLLKEIENYRYNLNRPYYEWRLGTYLSRILVKYLHEEHLLNEASEVEQLFYKKLVLDYVAKRDYELMFAYAIDLFQGYVFDKDYDKAAQMFLECTNDCQDDQSAYFLGEMYLNGYLEGGTTSYEKAFPYIATAASSGHPMSMLLMGDYFFNGYVGPMNDQAALFWYGRTYLDARRVIEKGYKSYIFAQAAYRMGRLLRETADEEKDADQLMHAYSLFLEAALTFKSMAMDDHNNYFNGDIQGDIETELMELKAILFTDTMRPFHIFDPLEIMQDLLGDEDDYLIHCTSSRVGLNDYRLHFAVDEFMKASYDDEECVGQRFLLTIPTMSLSILTNELVLYISDVTLFESQEDDDDEDFAFTRIEEGENGEVVFYFFEEEVARIDAVHWALHLDDLTNLENHEDEQKVIFFGMEMPSIYLK